MTSRILSTGILDRDDARRVLGQLLARGGNLLEHGVEDEGAAALGLAERLGDDLVDRPLALLSICRAVMPSVVPQTLKSMSPRKSSRPWMSVRMTCWSGAARRFTG